MKLEDMEEIKQFYCELNLLGFGFTLYGLCWDFGLYHCRLIFIVDLVFVFMLLLLLLVGCFNGKTVNFSDRIENSSPFFILLIKLEA